jgi:hypothetical protein
VAVAANVLAAGAVEVAGGGVAPLPAAAALLPAAGGGALAALAGGGAVPFAAAADSVWTSTVAVATVLFAAVWLTASTCRLQAVRK